MNPNGADAERAVLDKLADRETDNRQASLYILRSPREAIYVPSLCETNPIPTFFFRLPPSFAHRVTQSESERADTDLDACRSPKR